VPEARRLTVAVFGVTGAAHVLAGTPGPRISDREEAMC
jgi:hypothetical protein